MIATIAVVLRNESGKVSIVGSTRRGDWLSYACTCFHIDDAEAVIAAIREVVYGPLSALALKAADKDT